MRLTEHKFQSMLLVALSRVQGCKVWRNVVGTFRAYSNPEQIVKVGVPGQADIFGMIDGRFLSIEVKAPRGRVRKEQERWGEMVNREGGIHIVARAGCDLDESVREIVSLVELSRNGNPPGHRDQGGAMR